MPKKQGSFLSRIRELPVATKSFVDALPPDLRDDLTQVAKDKAAGLVTCGNDMLLSEFVKEITERGLNMKPPGITSFRKAMKKLSENT